MSFVFRKSSKPCCSNCSTGVLLKSEGRGQGEERDGRSKSSCESPQSRGQPCSPRVSILRVSGIPPGSLEPQAARLAACSIFDEEFFPNYPGLLLPPSYYFYILEVFRRLSEMGGELRGQLYPILRTGCLSLWNP